MNTESRKTAQSSDMQQITFHIIQQQETLFRMEDSLHLVFGLRGTGQVFAADRMSEICTDGILAIRPGQLYRISCLDASLLLLQIPSSILAAVGQSEFGRCSCGIRDGKGIQPEYQRIRELGASLLYEYLQNRHAVSLNGSGTLLQLLRYLSENFCAGAEDPAETGPQAAFIIRYIDAHWNEDLTLTSLAEQVHFSVSYLSRFFQKATGMIFSSYIRKVRMIHAQQLLLRENISITQIAYDCGFRNPSVFIETFKQVHQMTPGRFRQQQLDAVRFREQAGAPDDQRNGLSALLVHIPDPQTPDIALRKEVITLSCASVLRENYGQQRILNIGYARDGLLAPVREQMERAQREIGFTWFRCHGILDDDMHVYAENAEGEPLFSFAWVDMLFDFVTGLGLTPYIELGFMPSALARKQNRIFDRPSVISGCTSPDKWTSLIRALLLHLAERYGRDAVRTWRFAAISLSYVRIGCLTLDEYALLYETTYRAVKAFDPQIAFGGCGCFPDMTDNADIGMPWFLQFTSAHACMPDFYSMQWYPCVQTDDTLFMEYTMNQRSAPAILSTDPDYLRRKLDELGSLFDAWGIRNSELFLDECSSTLWQRDLAGDTCFKAVWLARNMTISAGRAVFGYWLLTDCMEERAQIRSVFHGGYGLFTCTGIPKAGYTAMRMISALEGALLAEGEGYVLTGRNGAYRLLVYNYSHYSDLNCYRCRQMEDPADAYSVFRPGEKMELQFRLTGLPAGTYRIRRERLDRRHGSAFDRWLALGAPAYPDQAETEYLRLQAEPAIQMEKTACSGTLLLEAACMPLEMELICIEPA